MADARFSTCRLASTFDGNTNANWLMAVLYSQSLPRIKAKYYAKYNIWKIVSEMSPKTFLHMVQINNAYRKKIGKKSWSFGLLLHFSINHFSPQRRKNSVFVFFTLYTYISNTKLHTIVFNSLLWCIWCSSTIH